MTVSAIEAVASLTGAERLLSQTAGTVQAHSGGAGFSQMLLEGIRSVDAKLAAADAQVRAFALDDSIPVHQVTYALEQARLSLDLMLQVRARLIEGYQQIIAMQL